MMSTEEQIAAYIESLPEAKRTEMLFLHQRVLQLMPECKLWFLDGNNSDGKIISNPNIGYGSYTINYAGGKSREFYQIGLSANTTGISVYIMGIEDKQYLKRVYGEQIGKAAISGYCIKFRHLKDIELSVLESAIRFGFQI